MRLFVESGPMAGTQIDLDREHPATLGSGDECTIRILDPGVVGAHAVVKALRDDGFGVKALAPGLRVNGTEVQAAPLKDGDVLEIGTTRLVYGKEHAAGPRIAGFRILDELGRGGMGIVYRAEQQSLHRQVALKVLDRRLLRDPQFVARFVAEARAAAKLSHPNVVPVFDVDHDGETYYYAMELMPHGSLEAWLKKHGKMPVDRALQVIADAASGLAYAESLRIVHGDIKPDNLMLDQHGTVKIADLGLARTPDDHGEALTGTPHFMAPELVLRQPLDHRSDLYALGCTFYRLVTGNTPFRGTTVKDIVRAQVKESAEPAHRVEPTVPAEVSAIIQRLMQKQAADRFQSANELLAVVNALLQPPARRGLWIGLAAAAVLVAGGTIYWAVNKPAEQTIVEKYRDNPEALRLATENEQLKAGAREDAALVALLRTRIDGGGGAELARNLEAVATAHPGTRAGQEARALATRVRQELADKEAAARGRQQATEAALAGLTQQVDQALASGGPARALQLVADVRPPAAADPDAFTAGVASQRQRVRTRAQDLLAGLGRDLETARAASDVAALQAVTGQLEVALATDGGWPAELLPDRVAVERLLADSRQAVADLQATARATEWQRYAGLLRDPQGPLAAVRALDFARAALAVDGFAGGLADVPARERAETLAAALRMAAPCVEQLLAAAGSGQLALTVDDVQLKITAWQPATAAFTVADTRSKPAKELVVPASTLSPERWSILGEQLATAPADSRICFVAFMALQQHVASAQEYLLRLRPDDDGSGTGEAGYPIGVLLFEQTLRRLPAEPSRWCDGLRSELEAARLLASGLRALSERRNLAAATQLNQLLTDHPHSLAVMALP